MRQWSAAAEPSERGRTAVSAISLSQGVSSATPLVAEVLAKYDRTVDGAHNPLVALARRGKAEPRHWNQLIRNLGAGIPSQIAGYGAGVGRFPFAPEAWPFMDFATYKLKAGPLLAEASEAIEARYPSAVPVGPPPSEALQYGWCWLWVGSVLGKAAAGAAMYAGLFEWYRVCVDLLDALYGKEPEPPEEFLKVLLRFRDRPEPLDHCLVLAERGLAEGDRAEEAVQAMDVSFSATAAFLEACAR